MNRKNFVLLDLSIVGLIVIGMMIYIFMGPAEARSELKMKEKDIALRKGQLLQGRSGLAETKEAVEAGLEKIEKALVPLQSLALSIGERYRPEGKENPPNYYKQLVVTLQKRVSGGQTGPTYAGDETLGFSSKMEEKENVRALLLRVAAVERLVEILRSAGSVKVKSIEHLPIRPLAGVGQEYSGSALVPVKVTFTGGERQAALFVLSLTAPATSGILETFRTESATDAGGLKVEALISFIVTDASDVLPKAAGDTTGPKTLPRRW